MEKKQLRREELEQLIIEFMKDQCTCMIATCSDNIPRATTVEFFPMGATIYILTEGGKKVENIMKNPHVSIAISTPLKCWESLKGLQITGIAESGKSGSRVFEEGLEAYKKRRGMKIAALPTFMNVIKVTPKKIEYLDTSLHAKGFNIKQVLEYR